MRITGGIARGIVLKSCTRQGLRPATDRMRQAVFSRLGSTIQGTHFLDLFAGTGAYGLEALSRGASRGVFIEQNRRTVATLKVNLAAITKAFGQTTPLCRIIAADILNWKPTCGDTFDFIFVDPPYSLIKKNSQALSRLFDQCLAANPRARVIFEMPGGLDLAFEHWKVERRLGSRGRQSPSVVIYQPK